MKIIHFLFFLTGMLLFFAGCKKSDNPGDPAPATPTIASITPASGPAGTPVTITGNNFGTDASTVKVFFNGLASGVQSVSNTQITTVAPAAGTTGIVSVKVGNNTVNGPVFTYTVAPLSVTGITPSSGGPKTVVTITGNNFGTDTAALKVFFNGVPASFQSLTNIQAVVIAPPNASTGTVKVQLGSQSVNGPIFTYIVSTMVTTLAGSRDHQGFADGTGAAAQFNSPVGIAVDAQGNVFVTDEVNQRIRKVTPAGVVTTFAGSAQQGLNDGTGASAQFYYPEGIAIDAAGNMVVADSRSNLIRKITPAAVVTTLAGNIIPGFIDGTGNTAHFNSPAGVSIDAAGNTYVADDNNHSIRKITVAGAVTTIAGNGLAGYTNGTGGAAQFRFPFGVTADAQGNIYVADDQNNRIRKITSTGVVTTLAGDGTFGYADGAAATARFAFPSDLKVDAQGNIFVADRGNHCIRKISTAGQVSTVAGVPGQSGFLDGGTGTARFYQPYGLALDAQGNIYVADYLNFAIRKISFQ